MLFWVLVAAGVLLAQWSRWTGLFFFPFLGAGIFIHARKKWGLTASWSPLFFIASTFLFAWAFPRSQESFFLLGAALFVLALFQEGMAEDASGQVPVGPVLRRTPVFVLFALYLAFAGISAFTLFRSLLGVPVGVLVGAGAAGVARMILGRVEDIRKGEARPMAEYSLGALVYAVAFGELILMSSFLPFAALARAAFLATLFWLARELEATVRAADIRVARIVVSGAAAVIICATIFLTAPWP